jgi:hypothetical protein
LWEYKRKRRKIPKKERGKREKRRISEDLLVLLAFLLAKILEIL